MSKIILKKNKGILFWITGLSGSGKTSISKLIKPEIEKKYGKTILLSGDDLRKAFSLNNFDKKSRKEYGIKFIKLAKLITDQKVNLILAIVGMNEKLRKLNRKMLKNYIEIYIQTDVKKIKKIGKKKIYKKFNKNIVGLDIFAELPKSPDIKIINNFDLNLHLIKKKLIKKIIELTS